jgi:NTP pyrophosphatase (non-canonical NTP hydrolase)|tara:strand:+ start:4116 stop:4532 length:417 start_codon:yes stop_codon:yes gene_type:complete
MDLNDYEEFVSTVTSKESNDTIAMAKRIDELNKSTGGMLHRVNFSLLLTGAMGMSSEGGEFAEIVKKCLFQGKPLDADTQYHLKRELGDVIWYWINSCRALGLDPNEVIKENVFKLESRYPGGKFDAYFSENRKQGDL